ncbi:hypothetical protein CROQUDRAFT_725891 [Cronartium quercuum f. sp. fusiforme G11]|uniref:Secreted protein n=1 Tax=Cronartium quercuum f. sp. fusiforme G11 TaxID=708437 RepID=A0A9P6T6L5_9BASI|nr:hypothetical protein CROQUDRAFT_725891 [Cronartium quercuum f. sp. fusiforme G11]
MNLSQMTLLLALAGLSVGDTLFRCKNDALLGVCGKLPDGHGQVNDAVPAGQVGWTWTCNGRYKRIATCCLDALDGQKHQAQYCSEATTKSGVFDCPKPFQYAACGNQLKSEVLSGAVPAVKWGQLYNCHSRQPSCCKRQSTKDKKGYSCQAPALIE